MEGGGLEGAAVGGPGGRHESSSGRGRRVYTCNGLGEGTLALGDTGNGIGKGVATNVSDGLTRGGEK